MYGILDLYDILGTQINVGLLKTVKQLINCNHFKYFIYTGATHLLVIKFRIHDVDAPLHWLNYVK